MREKEDEGRRGGLWEGGTMGGPVWEGGQDLGLRMGIPGTPALCQAAWICTADFNSIDPNSPTQLHTTLLRVKESSAVTSPALEIAQASGLPVPTWG